MFHVVRVGFSLFSHRFYTKDAFSTARTRFKSYRCQSTRHMTKATHFEKCYRMFARVTKLLLLFIIIFIILLAIFSKLFGYIFLFYSIILSEEK